MIDDVALIGLLIMDGFYDCKMTGDELLGYYDNKLWRIQCTCVALGVSNIY